MRHARFLIGLIALALPLSAGSIYVTDQPAAELKHGGQLWVDFSVWTYGYHNPDASPYPTSIDLAIAGPSVEAAPRAAIPGTSLEYFTGYLFQGWLESLDGSVSVPLVDSSARLLGLADGLILAAPGTVAHGGSLTEVVLLTALASFDIEASEALFGANVSDHGASARLLLRNAGEAFQIGLGPGYTVRDAVMFPGVSGDGDVRTSGITSEVIVSNPEPGTTALVAISACLLIYRLRRARRRSTPTRS